MRGEHDRREELHFDRMYSSEEIEEYVKESQYLISFAETRFQEVVFRVIQAFRREKRGIGVEFWGRGHPVSIK